MVLPEDRERARRLATTVVAFAIGVAALTLATFAVLLVVRGGLGLIFLAILLLALAGLLGFVGFFFQLVPFRLDELAAEKRAFDERSRDERH